MTDLEGYIKSAAKAARKSRGKPGDTGTLAGHHEGLVAAGRARLAPDDGESVTHHAGYLSGHLTRWMVERGQRLADPLPQTVGYYASAVADPHGQKFFTRPEGLIAVHGYAAIVVEKKLGVAVTEEHEQLLIDWLLEQAGKRALPGLRDVVDRRRRMRHERLGL